MTPFPFFDAPIITYFKSIMHNRFYAIKIANRRNTQTYLQACFLDH